MIVEGQIQFLKVGFTFQRSENAPAEDLGLFEKKAILSVGLKKNTTKGLKKKSSSINLFKGTYCIHILAIGSVHD